MNEYSNVGHTIKYLRKKAGYSQNELANGICTREYLGKIERGICSPTLEMINQLSDRLGANVYESYALILEHHDIHTHECIEELNEAIAERNFKTLKELIDQYANQESFSEGIPFKIIMYAQAVYYGSYLHDCRASVKAALDGLGPDYTKIFEKSPETMVMSTADLLLMQTAAVNLCRQGSINDSKVFFDYLIHHLDNRLNANRYLINRNRRFELNFYAHTIYNYCIFFHDDSEQAYNMVCEAIDKLKRHNFSNCLSELLFCKARIEHNTQRTKEEADSLSAARAFAKFFYDPSKAKKLEEQIMDS